MRGSGLEMELGAPSAWRFLQFYTLKHNFDLIFKLRIILFKQYNLGQTCGQKVKFF